jgi:membrane associated rhomboid family serine protease
LRRRALRSCDILGATVFPAIPPATWALIVANVLVYILQGATGDALVRLFALWPLDTAPVDAAGADFEPWQIVTYSFLHGGLAHLLLNMLALFMFGSEIERVMGRRRYLIYYLVSVVAAALTQLFVASATGSHYPTVGASGGVFGLLLAYGIFFPTRTILLLFPPIPMPAWLFVIVYAAVELYLGVTESLAGVAHFAHLGGMVGGLVMLRYWRGRAMFRRW